MSTTLTHPLGDVDADRDAPLDRDAIETRASREKRYRAALVEAQKGQGRRLKEFLLALRDYYAGLDSEARRKRNQDADRMVRYYNGDQYGDHNAQGVWESYTLQDGDFAYTVPLLNAHVEQALMMILKTRPEYVFDPKGNEDGDRRTLARMCQTLALEDYARLMTEDVRQEENLWRLMAGESYRCLYWGECGRTETRPRVVTDEKELTGARACAACRREVPEGDECPACGGSEITEAAGAKTERAVATGETEEIRLGENKLFTPSPVAVQRDFSAPRMDDSPFVIVRDRVPRLRAEWEDKASLRSHEGFSEEGEMQTAQARAGQQTDAEVGSARGGSRWGFGNSEEVERTRMWLDPSEYGWFYLDVPETTPDGKKLSAGKLLGDIYPDGAYVEFKGDTIIALTERKRRRQWSVVLYGKRPGTGRGTGMQSLIPLQDIINDLFNLDYAILMTSARPITAAYRPSVRALPEPGQLLLIDKLPEGGGGIESVIKQFPGQAASGVVGVTGQRIEAAMQYISGTQSSMGGQGAADIRAMGTTATAVLAAQEQAAGRMAPAIGQMITADKEFLWQILENIQEYSSEEQKAEMEKRFGREAVRSFFDADLRRELSLSVAENTDRPKSQALTQANLLAYGQMAGSLAQVPGGPELLAQMSEALGLPLSLGEGRADRKEAEYRLNKLLALEARLREKNPAFLADDERAAKYMYEKLAKWCAPLVATAADAEAAAGETGADIPQMFMQDHPSFMDVYHDWLFGDASRAASDATRMVVIRLWQDHFEAQVRRDSKLQALQAELAKNLMLQEPPAPSPEEQAAAAEAERAKALEEEALRRQADEEAKDADLERKMAAEEHKAMLQAELAGGAGEDNGMPPMPDDVGDIPFGAGAPPAMPPPL